MKRFKLPKLTVIIVSYNTRESLIRCLASLEQETKRTREQELEIVVVDNGSTDGSKEYLKVQSSKLKATTQNLKLIFNRENLGFAKAVNQGIRVAEGKTILLLNSDTQVKLGVLEKLLEFEEKVKPAIIGLRMLNPDGSVQGSVFNLPTVKRAIEEFWLGRKNAFSKYAPLGIKPVEVEAVSGGAMAISREVFEKIGLLDERYFMYFEDLDYCRKARRAGFKVWYLPAAEVVHEHGASGKELAVFEDQWKRLIPSSEIYHGVFRHWLITQIIKIGGMV